MNASVTSGNTLHTFHSNCLPFPENPDAVSHPVKVCNAGRYASLDNPNAFAISWAGRYQKSFPVPNASHNF